MILLIKLCKNDEIYKWNSRMEIEKFDFKGWDFLEALKVGEWGSYQKKKNVHQEIN